MHCTSQTVHKSVRLKLDFLDCSLMASWYWETSTKDQGIVGKNYRKLCGYYLTSIQRHKCVWFCGFRRHIFDFFSWNLSEKLGKFPNSSWLFFCAGLTKLFFWVSIHPLLRILLMTKLWKHWNITQMFTEGCSALNKWKRAADGNIWSVWTDEAITMLLKSICKTKT